MTTFSQVKKVKHTLSTQDIYEILRKEILDLKLFPGQALSESQMTTRFSVSRTPIRNVFAYLERDGLVEIIPQKGTYVSLIDLDTAEQTIFLRIQLELAVMRYISHNPDYKLFAQLEKNLEYQKNQIEQNVTIDTEFYRGDSQFHELCVASMGKRKAWQMIQDIDVQYTRYRLIDYHNDNVYALLHKEHSELFHLMVNGDTKNLNQAITEHLYGGILRFSSDLFDKNRHLFTESNRSFDELVRDVKFTINRSLLD